MQSQYRKLLLFIIIILYSIAVNAQNYYWVAFSNKAGTSYKLDEPQSFLSDRAIQRRSKQNIAIDSLDLPVNQSYINQITALKATLVNQSKWLNGITVATDDSLFLDKAQALPFVVQVQLTKPDMSKKKAKRKFLSQLTKLTTPIDTSMYGESVHQVGQLNLQYLHSKNIKGKGMSIAIIDAGFFKANAFKSLDSLWQNNQILGTHDFVQSNSDIFQQHQHGTSVLSCMGAYTEGVLIGTAPKASYWLLRSEDVSSEYLIEEDNWVAAAEFADSVGVDIINTSLGYNHFDDSLTNHTYAQMDGATTRITKAADIAFKKGILVFSSAGNEGNKSWKYLTAPSDGKNVICVGAVNQYGRRASFSSLGPSADNKTKPNLVALGYKTAVQSASGSIVLGYGTSYASPVLCGATACLWQANPTADVTQMKEALEKSASQYQNPNNEIGYGIPNMEKADKILKSMLSATSLKNNNWKVYPNPFNTNITIEKTTPFDVNSLKIDLFSIDGKSISTQKESNYNTIKLTIKQKLPVGVYLLRMSDKNSSEVVKIHKTVF